MKNYAKVGNRKGKPAYRTPSRFIAKKTILARKLARERTTLSRFRARSGYANVPTRIPRSWDLAARLEHRRIKSKKR